MHSPPVKLVAEKHNIPVFQPEKLSKAFDTVDLIKKLNPDLMVTSLAVNVLAERTQTSLVQAA